jgi:hypothetical protein
MSKDNFAIHVDVVFVWVGVNLTNFENLSTITKMAFVPFHFGRHVIKSIKTLSNGLDGIGRGLDNPNFSYVPIWYFGILHKCEHNVLSLPSFRANRKFSLKTPLLSSHHDVPPWAHHVLQTILLSSRGQ